ncbi:hypothetical protein [Streptomyces marianii]|uniref:hypothetical protein n=1 Tax=Streptomyces marianii TaxID=1817406 RepID=UPI00267D21E9
MDTLLLTAIARRAGVGRAAVVNWRRRHDDFPQPVGGTADHPEFRTDEAEAWLRKHGKILEPAPPAPPATLTFADGHTATLHSPHLLERDDFTDLGGYIERGRDVPWPTVDIARADVPDHKPFRVERASVDISHLDSPRWQFLLLTWPAERRQPLNPTTTSDSPHSREEHHQ